MSERMSTVASAFTLILILAHARHHFVQLQRHVLHLV